MTRRPPAAGQEHRQLALRWNPLVAFYEVTLAEAEELLIAWRHPLHLPTEQHPNGRPYKRPFGHMAFVMEDGGRRAAVVVLASTVNASVSKKHGLHRYNCVDLARLARSPDRRDARCLRAVLRITREYLVPLWPSRYPERWPRVEAAVTTSLPGTLSAQSAGHAGLYRFDGFERLRVTIGPSGGTYGKPSAANAIGDGQRGLWAYRYPAPLLAR